MHPLETWDADAGMKLFRERLLARPLLLLQRFETQYNRLLASFDGPHAVVEPRGDLKGES